MKQLNILIMHINTKEWMPLTRNVNGFIESYHQSIRDAHVNAVKGCLAWTRIFAIPIPPNSGSCKFSERDAGALNNALTPVQTYVQDSNNGTLYVPQSNDSNPGVLLGLEKNPKEGSLHVHLNNLIQQAFTSLREKKKYPANISQRVLPLQQLSAYYDKRATTWLYVFHRNPTFSCDAKLAAIIQLIGLVVNGKETFSSHHIDAIVQANKNLAKVAGDVFEHAAVQNGGVFFTLFAQSPENSNDLRTLKLQEECSTNHLVAEYNGST